MSVVLALTTAASAQTAPIPEPPSPAVPKLRFVTNQPGVSFHYAKLARPNPDFVPVEWTRLCLEECEVALPTGHYRFALSLGAEEPVLAPQLLQAGRSERLEGLYTDNSHRRTTGWAILGLGGASSLATITTGAVLAGRPSTERLGFATLAGGAVGLLLSLAFGLPLATTPDRAEVLRESHPH